MIDPNAPAHVAHIGLIDVEELRRRTGADGGQKGVGTVPNYDGGLAGFGQGVAGQMGEVAGGGKAPPLPQKTDSIRGETAA
jgi:hypothetical protein